MEPTFDQRPAAHILGHGIVTLAEIHYFFMIYFETFNNKQTIQQQTGPFGHEGCFPPESVRTVLKSGNLSAHTHVRALQRDRK